MRCMPARTHGVAAALSGRHESRVDHHAVPDRDAGADGDAGDESDGGLRVNFVPVSCGCSGGDQAPLGLGPFLRVMPRDRLDAKTGALHRRSRASSRGEPAQSGVL